jgi:hypothetical protein
MLTFRAWPKPKRHSDPSNPICPRQARGSEQRPDPCLPPYRCERCAEPSCETEWAFGAPCRACGGRIVRDQEGEAFPAESPLFSFTLQLIVGGSLALMLLSYLCLFGR